MEETFHPMGPLKFCTLLSVYRVMQDFLHPRWDFEFPGMYGTFNRLQRGKEALQQAPGFPFWG